VISRGHGSDNAGAGRAGQETKTVEHGDGATMRTAPEVLRPQDIGEPRLHQCRSSQVRIVHHSGTAQTYCPDSSTVARHEISDLVKVP